MLKYLLIALALAGLGYWYVERRRRAVRDRLRDEELGRPELGSQKLVRCPRCGVYKVKGSPCCDSEGTPRG